MSIEDDDKEASLNILKKQFFPPDEYFGEMEEVMTGSRAYKHNKADLQPTQGLSSSAINPAHYNRFPIQPIDFIIKNKLSYLQGNIIKYVCRFDAKNGVEDLKKAKQYLEWLIEEAEKNGR